MLIDGVPHKYTGTNHCNGFAVMLPLQTLVFKREPNIIITYIKIIYTMNETSLT